jgi:serine/threonine-protein kinase
LAILPIEGSGDTVELGNGALTAVAERLSQRSRPPTIVVIPPYRSLAADVHTPMQAHRALDATHAFQIALRREGNELVANGAVFELATNTRLHEINGRYPASQAGDLSTALLGAVARALRFHDTAGDSILAGAAAPYLRALSYLRRDQHSFDLAIPLFRQAMQLDPHSPLPKAGLVEALVLSYQDTKERQRMNDAERMLQTAEALNPASIAVLMAKARFDTVQGRYEKALASYKEIVEIQPRNVEVWLRTADVYARLDRREEAIESYRKAIALEPGYYETYEELGVFYWGRGEFAEAAAQFGKAIEHAPRFLNAYTNLGATLNEMGNNDGAERALLASLEIKQTAGALNSLGVIRAYQRRDAEAIAFYKRSLVLDAHSYICLMNLGDASRRQGLDADALDAYRQGNELAQSDLQTNPSNGYVRAYVGSFAAKLGDSARGRQEIEQALHFAPSDKRVIWRAVLTFELLGDRERALKIAETATSNVIAELDRHPDLADFREDRRFKELKAKREKGG